MALELVPEDDDSPQQAASETEGEATPYDGPERRKAERRQVVDRRDMVRFEAKSDRRSGQERRRGLGLWKLRDT